MYSVFYVDIRLGLIAKLIEIEKGIQGLDNGKRISCASFLKNISKLIKIFLSEQAELKRYKISDYLLEN